MHLMEKGLILMHLSKISINYFGKLKDFEIDFAEGMNVIYGRNEAGKSTILSFIKSMLYGFPSSRKESIRDNDRKRYMPWGNNIASGEIQIEENGMIYIIKRSFGEKKSQDKIQIIKGVSGEEISFNEMDKPGKTLFQIDENTYEKTGFIEQLSCEVTKENSDEVIRYLTNLQGTGDASVSYTQAKRDLEEYRKGLVNTQRKPGIIDQLKEEYDKKFEVFNRLKIANQSFDEHAENNTIDWESEMQNILSFKDVIGEYNMDAVKAKIVQQKNIENILEKKLKERSDMENEQEKLAQMPDIIAMNSIQANEDLGRIIEEKIRMETYAEQIEKNKEIEKQIAQIKKENEILQKEEIEKIKADIEKSEKMLKRIEEIRIHSDISEEMPLNYKLNANKLGLVLSFLILIGAAFLLTSYLPWPVVFVFALPCIFFISRIQKLSNEIRSIKNSKVKLTDELKSIENQLDQLYRSHGTANQWELKDKYHKIQIDLERSQTILIEKEKQLKENQEKRFEDLYKKSADFIEQILEKYRCKSKEELKEKIEQHDHIKLKYNQQKEIIERIKKEEESYKDQLEQMAEDRKQELSMLYENAALSLQSQMELLKKKIALYEKEREAVDTALDILEESFQKFHMEFGSKLNNSASKVLDKITSKKYDDIMISKEFEVKISDKATKEIRSAEYFSNGTWDQIYFSVRMGIAEAIAEKINKKLPVILDDAFVQYDEERLFSALEYLYEYSGTNQIILFSCQKREMEYLKKYSDIHFAII